MQEEYKKVIESEVFKKFHEENPNYEFANAFMMVSQQYAPNWQFGFYDDEKDDIVTFVSKPEGVEQQEHSEAMKEPTSKILTVDISQVKVTGDEAYAKAEETLKSEYQEDAGQTKIYLLQDTEEHGLVWNMTIISITFDVVNVKIDAKDGTVLVHSKHSLLDMQANT